MEQMAASAQELADMGVQLRSLVGKFNIGKREDVESKSQRLKDSGRVAKLREQTEEMRKRMAELKKKKDARKKK